MTVKLLIELSSTYPDLNESTGELLEYLGALADSEMMEMTVHRAL